LAPGLKPKIKPRRPESNIFPIAYCAILNLTERLPSLELTAPIKLKSRFKLKNYSLKTTIK